MVVATAPVLSRAALRLHTGRVLTLDRPSLGSDALREAIGDIASKRAAIDGAVPGTRARDYNVARNKITKPRSTDDIEGCYPFSQVRSPPCLPGGCTYQVQPSTASIRPLTGLNTEKPERPRWIEAKGTFARDR